jgi:hypothetical protein
MRKLPEAARPPARISRRHFAAPDTDPSTGPNVVARAVQLGRHRVCRVPVEVVAGAIVGPGWCEDRHVPSRRWRRCPPGWRGAWLFLLPVYRMTAREAAEAFAIVAAVHVPINVAGRLLGVRASASSGSSG